MFKNRYFIAFCSLILIIALGFTSCAMIFSGTKDHITINSNVTEADIYVDGNYIGKAPAIIKLSKSKKHSILIKKEGYTPFVIQTDKSLNAWFVADILLMPAFIGIVGIVLDFATGATYDIEPDNVFANLAKIDSAENNNIIIKPEEVNKIFEADSVGIAKNLLIIDWE